MNKFKNKRTMRTKELLLVLAVCAALYTNVCAYAGEQKRTASDNYKSMLVEGRVWKMMDCELSGWGNTIDKIYYSILIRENKSRKLKLSIRLRTGHQRTSPF